MASEINPAEIDLIEQATYIREPLDVPKANIVRIRILPPSERQKYLGTIDQAVDKNIKSPVYNTIFQDNPVFYGILQGDATQSITLGSDWGANSASTSIGSALRELGAKAGGDLLSGAGSILKAATGINASVTGSATQKTYNGAKISDFTVECGWYLPEQLELCLHSLRTISRMAYPIQIPKKALKHAIGAAVNTVFGNETVTSLGGANVLGDLGKEANDLQAAATGGKDQQGVNKGVAFISDSVQSINDALGRNMTLDPLPVRCSIGHFIDVEPLVITSVAVDFSKDTFVSEKNGRHLPVTCKVKIAFQFWMTPAPKLEFLELLGYEMFGEGIDMDKVAQGKVLTDKAMKAKELDSRRGEYRPGPEITGTTVEGAFSGVRRVSGVDALPPLRS